MASLTEDALGSPLWVPQPGPQTEAYLSDADDLFYGGQAGGGKTDLLLGLALTAHTKSLILRRQSNQVGGIVDRFGAILGTSEGRNLSPPPKWKVPGTDKVVTFAGVQLERDKEDWKGRDHDFYGFDEIPDFSRTQAMFIKTWNRSTKEGQRCRVVMAGNPPTSSEGLWVIEYFAAWLDPKHPNPAAEGELRWYIRDKTDKEHEVEGRGPHRVEHDDGSVEELIARSRTFIRAKLSDNAFLTNTDYAATLDALDPQMRAAYRDGAFDSSIKDRMDQIIPTSWVRAAQERWKQSGGRPPQGIPMCAIGDDVAQGGDDRNVLTARYDSWYAQPLIIPGKDTPLGSDNAARAISMRRDGAVIVVDMGGGYGGGVIQTLGENDIDFVAYKGAESPKARSKDGKMKFKNWRTQAYWQMREDLDPDQTGGSPVCLPEGQYVLADLTAVTYKVTAHGYEAETKESVVARLGRSPDEGDSIVMARQGGPTSVNIPGGFRNADNGYRRSGGRVLPKVNVGHEAQRRRR